MPFDRASQPPTSSRFQQGDHSQGRMMGVSIESVVIPSIVWQLGLSEEFGVWGMKMEGSWIRSWDERRWSLRATSYEHERMTDHRVVARLHVSDIESASSPAKSRWELAMEFIQAEQPG